MQHAQAEIFPKPRLLHPAQKTLVVGLGGTGKRVLVQLKRRLLEAGYQDSTAQPDLQLICLDFDPAEECATMRSDGQGKVCLAADEVCWLDGGLIHNRLRNLRQEHNLDFYRDWYPDQEGAVIQMGAYRAGAAQWRPLGRVGYYEYAERIQVVLRRSLNRLLEVNLKRSDQDQARGVVVYIVCSLAGGTGGGIFMDVAYFLRTMPVDLKQFGLLLLPGIYAEYDISGRLYANTYACLKELSVFANQGRAFEARYPNGKRISVPRQGQGPFDQLYLYDNIIQAGDTISNEMTTNVDVMSSLMAETVFFDIAEAKLNQMQQSAATNVTELAGAHEDSPLARQSVFSMVGSLTLLLPARQDLEALCGQLYLQKVLLKDMEQARAAQEQPREVDPQLAERASRRFPGLDAKIDQLVAKTKESCLHWEDADLDQASQELGQAILGYAGNPSQAQLHLDQWLGEFLAPRPDGGFSLVPRRLPDVALDRENTLHSAMRDLAADLEQQAQRTLGQAADKDAPRTEDLYHFLKIKAQSLCGLVAKERLELGRALEAAGGNLARLKDQLQALYASNPPQEERLDELSAVHWARRFLVAVQQYYGRYACAIRVHTLLAAVIDRVREEKLVDERTLLAALEALPQIKARAERGQQDLRESLKQANSATVRSLVDQDFLDSYWAWVQALVPTAGGFLDFLVYVKAGLSAQELASGPTPQRLAALASQFSLERFRQAWREASVQGLDLHCFVNPNLRAQELGRARHDYMVKDALLNTSKNHRAYAAMPAYGGRSSREDNGDIYQDFKGLVDNALEASTIQVHSYPARDLAPDQPGKILVRHVSLNHPATNLRGIAEYYYAYARYGANRKLFHIDMNFLGLPEVIDEDLRLKYVTCGNPGCHEDISELPRQTIICPHCRRPLRSRCGNDGCTDNELHLPRQGWDPNRPDKYCPTCHKLARTYWWRCQTHNVDLRTESNYCERCLAEHRAGLCGFENVSRRQDVKRHLECPGCLHDCKPEPFRIEFLEVYDEVPDEHSALAWEVYEQPTRHGCCPKCGAQLLPFCPYEENDQRRHFVHRFEAHSDCQRIRLLAQGQVERREGLFFCTSDQEHAQKPIKECSHCHLPLKQDATYCPRCKRQRLPEGNIAAYLEDRFPECQGPGRLAEDVADFIACKIAQEGWLWFGLNQEDWKRIKGDEEPKPAGQALETRDCGTTARRGQQGQGLPALAVEQFKLGREEETHEPV